jgi:PAS domain S-box-containing protein
MREELAIDFLSRKDAVLGTILDSLFDGVYLVDVNRRIVFWNTGAEKMTGYASDEVTGKRCSQNILNHIDSNGTLLCGTKCPLVKTLKTGYPVREKVYPLKKTGERFPVMTHIAPIRDSDSRIIGAIEVFRDISQEEELRILQEKFRTLIEKYVSNATLENVREQIARNGDSRGRMLDVTILYLDVVGFTPHSERHSPDEVVGMLNQVYEICGVITRKRQGDIDKFIGDAVMALFLDANDAVRAGREILEEMKVLNRERSKQGLEPVRIRIGINSGRVLQGEIGTINRKDLTVIGDPVNTASRIQQAAAPGRLTISEATRSRLKRGDDFVFSREIRLKGKEAPVAIFEYPGEEIPSPAH